MLAKLRPDIPRGEGWVYEPKWDGFRALVFRDGDEIQISSRNGQPLERYFPELIPVLERAIPALSIVDGEIVIAGKQGLDFDALLQRIHPAASRVNLLSEKTPASFVAFDLIAEGTEDLRGTALAERRSRLKRALRAERACFLTPQTEDPEEAQRWFDRFEGAGLDGVVAKQKDLEYRPGERVMVKVKHQRTADCLVGGYRLSKNGDGVGSLLLGLYDEDDVLHHVGHTSSFKAGERREVLAKIKPLEGSRGFGQGQAPGGPSRWTRGRDLSWISLEPRLVCEVAFDHLQGERFRHGARFLRWRPDKMARECTYDQLDSPRPFSLEEIRKLSNS